ncbi:MAG: plasmid pRiA4b ORF-3 family protein [Bacteroidales bacterium]|nr:plasmid pRiA4b ORF-3 family protein [Bacteroidales bacterium]
MYVYKFRLLFDDVEDFVRDYEILAKQTFKDFHQCIIDSIQGLNPEELASFYICDRKWNKRNEITLMDMSIDQDDEEEELRDEEEGEVQPTITMDEARISDFIDDPHQRIIYEHDFLNIRTFYIELLKSYEAKPDKTYPVCIHSSAELPLKYTVQMAANELLQEENSLNLLKDDEDDEVYYDESELEGFNSDFENI